MGRISDISMSGIRHRTGRISGIRPDIRPDIWYTAKYLTEYLVYGRIFHRISGIRPNILPYIRYPVGYSTGYLGYGRTFTGYAVSGRILVRMSCIPQDFR